VTLANHLSRSGHSATEAAIRFQQASVLDREWAPTKGGTVLMSPSLWRGVSIQLRPEYASPRALLDLRVRQALAASMDREGLNGAVLEGRGAVVDHLISPLVDYYAEIDRAAVKHPYDPRRSEQLMNEAGFTKGSDGRF